MADPAGFSSPMGGNQGRRATAAAAADLVKLVDLSAKYEQHMEKAAQAAEKTSKISRRPSMPSIAEIGVGGDRNNPLIGGGARMPVMPGSRTAAGLPPMVDTETNAQSKQYRVSAPRDNVNGGGARMPKAGPSAAAAAGGNIPPKNTTASTGSSNGGPTSFAETAARGAAITDTAAATPPPGGGFGQALGKFALGAVGGAFAGLTSEGAVTSFRSADYLANRAALASGGSYNKQAGANNLLRWAQNSFRSDAERSAFVMPLLRQGGEAGSSQFNAIAEASRGIAQRDPLAAATASQVQLGLGAPKLFNNARLLGIQTLDPGGAPRSLGNVVQQVSSMMSAGEQNPNAVPSAARVGQTFTPGGRMRVQLQQMGMSEDQINAAQAYLWDSSKAGKWLPDAKAGKAGDTMLGADQGAASGKTDALTAALKTYSDGYIAAQQAITAGMKDLADVIRAMPDRLKEAVFGTAGAGGALKHGGGLPGGVGTAAVGAGLLGARALTRNAVRTNKGIKSGVRAGTRARPGRAGALGIASIGADYASQYLDDHYGGNSGWQKTGRAAATIGSDALTGAAIGAMVPIPGVDIATSGIGAAVGTAWGAVSAFRNWGDGPGRPASLGSAYWPGTTVGTFNGRQFGDGPGTDSAQAAAAKTRGGETVGVLEELLKGYKGGAVVTSSIRHGSSGVTVSGNVSYHATGNAIDVAATSPGVDSPELLSINKYFAQFAPGLNELIYAGPGGTLIKDGRSVGPSFYGKDVMDIHHNHVHVAATVGMLKNLKGKGTGKGGGGLFSRILDGIKGAASAVLGGVESVVGGIGSALGIGGKPTAKPKTNGGAGASAAAVTSGMIRGLTKAKGGYSQEAVIEQLLQGLGPAFSSIGSHKTTADPGEAVAGAAAKVDGTAAAMPEGNAMANALTIIKVAKEMGISKRGAVIGIATAEQESNLINLHSGDRDSQGLFQQRPSQGWGSVAEVTNPVHASKSFFSRLKGLDYEHMPLTKAAQEVQRSAFPDAYAKWEGPAQSIVDHSKVYGDGPGRAGAMAMTTTADVPPLQRHTSSGSGAGGNTTVHSHGGSSIRIGKVEVHLTAPQVSQAEAKRIGKMVVDEIAIQARMTEMSR